MQSYDWIDHLPEESLDGGLKMLNEIYWNISIEHQENGHWRVWAGDQSLLLTDSRDAVDTFIYGMALSWTVIPEHIFEQWKQEMKEEMEG